MANNYPNSFTSQMPEDDKNPESALMFAMQKFMMNNVDGLLPAIVVAYDRKKNIATVQPIIQRVDVNNQVYDRRPLVNIQCLSLGSAGFHINFPLKKGALGWIIAADRDIDLFRQSLLTTIPNTSRSKTFADGWFIPDTMRKYVIADGDEEFMVIQSTNANSRIAIGEEEIRVHVGGTKVTITPSGVTVDANAATINAPKSTFNGDVDVNGKLKVSDSASVGSLKSSGGISGANDINLVQHGHKDAEGRNTSSPISV